MPDSAFTPPLVPEYGVLDKGLLPNELWWRDHYVWLGEIGYALRPRYEPGWTPPWVGTGRHPYDFESAPNLGWGHVIDATRKSDGAFVTLKRIKKSVHPYEASIGQYFSGPLASDPRNHCCPIYDVIQAPDDDDVVILVMPLLRKYGQPPFTSIGEIMECFRQVFEGLQFMHSHHVAHRDCMTLNIMMDAIQLYPAMYHPQFTYKKLDWSGDVRRTLSRTERPTRYYLVDFGLSRRYGPEDTNPLEEPIFGGDRSVPEFLEDPEKHRNPFHTDVYYLGNVLREDILEYYTNLGFLDPLVQSMVATDPATRPTMDEVVERFNKLLKSISWWKLRSRPVRRQDEGLVNFVKDVWHVYKTTTYAVRLMRALPTPRAS